MTGSSLRIGVALVLTVSPPASTPWWGPQLVSVRQCRIIEALLCWINLQLWLILWSNLYYTVKNMNVATDLIYCNHIETVYISNLVHQEKVFFDIWNEDDIRKSDYRAQLLFCVQ